VEFINDPDSTITKIKRENVTGININGRDYLKISAPINFPQGYASDEDVKGPYLSNSTAREVLTALGMNPDFENSEPVKIEVFINLATQWLQKHIGKPSTTKTATVNKTDTGATVYDMGKPQGRLNDLILQLSQQARKIKQKYPTITHVAFV
jgi:hypothetical protein